MSEAIADTGAEAPLKKTPLHELHVELGAKMVPFAGYDMPVQYKDGVLTEHLHTRQAAGLFDVSHMGQAFLTGPDHETVARAMEKLVPGDVLVLEPGSTRYTLLLNEKGGIRDDLMITRMAGAENDGKLFLVVNAACKDADFAHIAANMPAGVTLSVLADRALIALQGPKAAAAMAELAPQTADQAFMTVNETDIDGAACLVSRSGYTGEDGFEISVPADKVEALTRKLLSDERVKPIGLGARDSLRLEAGLCLYGHDLDEDTTPIEGALTWTISKRRRAEDEFPGAEIVLGQITNGVSRKRVGILPEGKAPAREGTDITDMDGNKIGVVTSGGYGPSVGGPIAMGYVKTDFAKDGTPLQLVVRGKARPARVAKMPFVEKRFYRGK
ncbi:glycine cleavage system aminomethyltransferase GcvT [Parvibaculum sp. MBR-TMA-1.3b-4.2]|jgi:aminomethyltransferase